MIYVINGVRVKTTMAILIKDRVPVYTTYNIGNV